MKNINKERNSNDNEIGSIKNNEFNKNPQLIQRLYKYNHDIRNILIFWKKNMNSLRIKKETIINLMIKKNEDDNLNKDLHIIKKVNKREIGCKYDFNKPEDKITLLVPLCNDIFTIAKNDQ